MQRIPKSKALVRSASDSTWKNYAALREVFPNRLSLGSIYHRVGYENTDQDYIATGSDNTSIKTSITFVNNSSITGMKQTFNSESEEKIKNESPYAKIINKKKKVKIQFSKENDYNYPL